MGLPHYMPRFDTDIVKPYWDALAEGEMQLPACSECGSWQWYPFEVPRCHPLAHLVWKSVPTTGAVFACTTVQRCLLPDNKEAAPYTNALIELDGVKGPRIVGLLINFNDEPVAGAKVKLHATKSGDISLPTFEPA